MATGGIVKSAGSMVLAQQGNYLPRSMMDKLGASSNIKGGVMFATPEDLRWCDFETFHRKAREVIHNLLRTR